MEGFFNVVSVTAFQALLEGVAPLPAVSLSIEDGLGLTLARDVTADEDLPLADRSSMDGYAVAAADTFGSGETNPGLLDCVGVVDIQTPPTFSLAPGQCAAIVTGGILPRGADAVLLVEQTQIVGAPENNVLGQAGDVIEIRRAVAPGEAVMRQGEDARAGAVLLPAGTLLRPQELGLLAALGVLEIPVHRRPRVAVISTGDEVVPITERPRLGQVRDVNSLTLAQLCRQCSAEPGLRTHAGDDPAALKAALDAALDDAEEGGHDVVLLSGGSSVGTRDCTLAAIQARPGAEVLAHGVAMSPGKPVILARVGHRTVWGLPGQVASAMVVMLVLVQPLLRRLMGDPTSLQWERRPGLTARLARNVASRQGREDYVRVRVAPGEDGLQATPELGPSGLLRTLVGSHGLVRIPAGLEGLEVGAMVDVKPFWM
ncbi:molybdopterin molybdotransferase MoeA [Megalodesulfovibrio gigas]|uniref:Molybdopterin molybdenumtransferase n=1 Tax=Megalodesulfovibrio gigas (strain ATCC 19364 / DSM 1382 / NCIMB 9332 / VKM B-1759) TaxID=1121448 RepID=T2GCL8_MEGG1|nr:gephyrin-like molybdotransferase Glp [Megalodesulfovibrio gigas]AGW14043.1 putative molybdenum cofactor synthesis domain protein [Megalodesulfovibrio gigas DSM 1382 = ATCC 19364]